MNIETVIYLSNILPPLRDFLGTPAVVFIIAGGIMSLVFWWGACDMQNKEIEEICIEYIKKYYVKNLKFAFIVIFVALLIPSEKTIYLMLGANYLKTSALPTKVEMAIEKKLDGYLSEKDDKK